MFKIYKYFKWRDWCLAVLTMSLIVFQVYNEMELIKYTGQIVGIITEGIATKQLLWEIALKMLATAFVIFLTICIVSYLASFTASNVSKRLRQMIFAKVNSFSLEEINKFSTASLITRSTNDITQIQQTIQMSLRMMITAPTMAIFSLVNIADVSLRLSWVTAIFLVLMFGVMITMYFVVIPKFGVIQQKIDNLNLVTRENLTGLRVIRAYNAESKQQSKFDKANNELTKTRLFVNRVTSLMSPSLNLIMNGMGVAIYWIGAYLVGDHIIGYRDITQFSQYSMHILMSFMFISMLFIMIPRGVTSAKRVDEVLTTQNKITDGTVTHTDRLGTIEFKNVSFKYPNAEGYVLKDINFSVSKGQTIAFIGSTGSGKSTLINLIPRFYDATEGEVLIDGVNVKDYNLATLNEKLGYVPQKATLFRGSIKQNILYGKKDATDEELDEALTIAQAKNFVSKLDGGLDYDIAQGGKNVSGGQRQRLSIARAIVGDPEFYIFDDSFSALDYKTDKALRDALKQKTSNATTVIVAQRIGTIMDADIIVVLDHGKIVGMGKHKQLLRNCKIYKEIALSQLSKEEL